MSNKVTPKERLSAYQRWEMQALDEAVRHRRAGQVAAGEAALPTAQDLEQIHGHAYQEGYNAGLQQGRAKAEAEVVELRQLLCGLREAMLGAEEQFAQEVLSVALAVARRIVRQSLNVKPEMVLPLIQEAIESLPQSSHPPKLILHPADAAMLQAFFETHKMPPPAWKIVENSHLERGGCQIETAASEIDVTLEARWKRVLASLGHDDAWLDLSEVDSPPPAV